MKARRSEIARKTRETDVKVALDLDGRGRSRIATGIGFFDHMLTSFATHGRFDLDVRCKGDLHVDAHHSVEDVGISIGDAPFKEAGHCGERRFSGGHRFLSPGSGRLLA